MINILKMANRREEFFKFTNFLFVGLFLLCVEFDCGFTSATGGGGETKTIRCLERERQALLMFKQDLVDDYGRLSSWGSEEDKRDCCKWSGVRCNNRTGRVIFLDLHGEPDTNFYFSINPLRGKVSASLLELHYLNHLDLSVNDFRNSEIPEFIGSFTRLTYLNLSAASFSGEVPSHLGNLTNLQSLDLGYNYYNYDLNAKNLEWVSRMLFLRYLDLSYISLTSATDWLQAISSLSSLVELHLSYCWLPSPILSPHFLSINYSSRSLSILDLSDNGLTTTSTYHWLFNLSSRFTRINLHWNSFEGPIPQAFGSMASLVDLNLARNNLDGAIPESFGNLSHLRSLDLSFNNLSESLPEFFKKLFGKTRSPLEILSLSYNQFSGSLPNITIFPSLRFLDISNNHLNGSLHESVGQLSRLEILDLFSNDLKGVVSEIHFANLPNLKALRLSYNSLSLNFNTNWIPPFQLDVIALGSCRTGPHFPSWLQTQKNMSFLDISNARISDRMPTWFWDLSPRLRYLNLSHNMIGGVVPDLSKRLGAYPIIDLGYNYFEGAIPLFPPSMRLLHLANNMFKGSISFVCSLGNDTLWSLDLSNNMLSGELPDCWLHVKELYVLNMANNNFSGKLPFSMGLMNNMRMLVLRNNSFNGEFPSSIRNLAALVVLDVASNKLTGNIPTWMGTNLSDLIILSLRHNKFYGSIPSHMCHLKTIQVLDLSQNNLSGKIPQCFNNFTSLLQNNTARGTIYVQIPIDDDTEGGFIANALVQWKGRESVYVKTLRQLKAIDLSSNRLVGKIPQEIATLSGLLSLNLSINNLTGNIMQNVGEMEMLEILDLAQNHLSSEIPTSLSNLHYLDVLDLSNNNFSGRIPTSTQLQSFDPSAYAGNNQLCGLPLPKCQGDETAPVPPKKDHQKDNNVEEDDDKILSREFYMSMVIGFVVGFWLIFGSMIFKDSCRRANFKSFNDMNEWIWLQTTLGVGRIRRKFES